MSTDGFKVYAQQIVGLDKLLAPEEQMVACAGGMMRTHQAGADTARNAVCVATDRRVVFYNRRMFGNYDFEDFAYNRVTSVQVRKGLMWGALDIYVAQVKKELYMTNNDCAETLANAIREKIHYKTPLVEAKQAPTDIPTQIRQLADLAKDGIISEEEFQVKKTQLLAKLQ